VTQKQQQYKICVVPGCEQKVYPHTDNPAGLCHKCMPIARIVVWIMNSVEQEKAKNKNVEKKTASGLIVPKGVSVPESGLKEK
jgi:hypothetical protein